MRKKVSAIRTTPPAEAEPDLATVYRWLAGSGEPAHIYQAHSLHSAALAAHAQLYRTLMFGPSPLSRVQRELIATLVSSDNACHY